MYLEKLAIENFRIFGAASDNKHLSLRLSPGLNLIVGENDSGKTCIVDALRLVLGTTPTEYFTLSVDDFHCGNGVRAKSLRISVEIADLTESDAAAFLEYLEVEQGSSATYKLHVTLSAERDDTVAATSRRSPVRWELRAGLGNEGQRLDGPARELLRATYLKPLRDAVSELTARKGSRLSQILHSYPELSGQDVNDWNAQDPDCTPKTLTGLARRAEHAMRETDVIRAAERKLNDSYLRPFSLLPKPLAGRIGIPGHELRQILERMELTLADHEPGATRGLGHHNLLFMAAELLALERDDDPCLPLVLIEEPEAHLHPQLQLRLVEFLRTETTAASSSTALQVILTSHSPNIASKIDLERITILHSGQAFPLHSSATKLDRSDYAFLSRFLDVTRSDLFFARGLLIVEGDAEAILLPTIAELIGCPLTANGVSIINVGSVGLFRYSRIFQRSDGSTAQVRVSCVADLDIPPDCARPHLATDRRTESHFNADERRQMVSNLCTDDGGAVKTFVSEAWTLEYDLALKGLSREVHAAITLAANSKSKRRALAPNEVRSCLRTAFREHRAWMESNRSASDMATDIYLPLLKKRASKPEAAQYLAWLLHRLHKDGSALESRLPAYLVEAIKYATRHGEVPMDERVSNGTAEGSLALARG